MIDRLDRQTKRLLLSLPFVVGIGHGLKEVGGIQTNADALVILVTKKVPADCLKTHQIAPKSIDGHSTDVIEVGHLTAHERSERRLLQEEHQARELQIVGDREDASVTSRIRPAVPGISIGHYLVTAGTFGAVVYDTDGQALILSNNHVLANASNGMGIRARLNDPVLQPGAYDGGRSKNNIIANLHRYVALRDTTVNRVDCALAKPLQPDLIKPEIFGIGTVLGVTTPSLGMEVKKSGRTTGVTYGTIRAINVTATVAYGSNRGLRFENQILTTGMSSPGDSGSLVLDSENRAVGLLFAGSDTSTIINPVQTVLDLLEVRF